MKRPDNFPLRGTETVVDRALDLLTQKMDAQGFDRQAVQQALGLQGAYISQLIRKNRGLRLDEIVAILGVIRLSPADFFQELFGSTLPPRIPEAKPDSIDELLPVLRGHSTDVVVVSLASVLVKSGQMTVSELVSMIRMLGGKR